MPCQGHQMITNLGLGDGRIRELYGVLFGLVDVDTSLVATDRGIEDMGKGELLELTRGGLGRGEMWQDESLLASHLTSSTSPHLKSPQRSPTHSTAQLAFNGPQPRFCQPDERRTDSTHPVLVLVRLLIANNVGNNGARGLELLELLSRLDFEGGGTSLLVDEVGEGSE